MNWREILQAAGIIVLVNLVSMALVFGRPKPEVRKSWARASWRNRFWAIGWAAMCGFPILAAFVIWGGRATGKAPVVQDVQDERKAGADK